MLLSIRIVSMLLSTSIVSGQMLLSIRIITVACLAFIITIGFAARLLGGLLLLLWGCLTPLSSSLFQETKALHLTIGFPARLFGGLK